MVLKPLTHLLHEDNLRPQFLGLQRVLLQTGWNALHFSHGGGSLEKGLEVGTMFRRNDDDNEADVNINRLESAVMRDGGEY